MTASALRILYIHGFNSAPSSAKAQAFKDYCQRHLPEASVEVPALSHDPQLAIAELEDIVSEVDLPPVLLVGSSLGGYYATWLSERYNIKAALVNPAVAPHRHLGEAFLGWHTNPYTGEQFEMTRAHGEALAAIEVAELKHPENFLLLVQTGDETLDYRLAVEKYAGSQQLVQPGGSHAFEDFPSVIPEILRFAGLLDEAG